MDRLERFLGSSLVSHLCVIFLLLTYDVSVWVYFAVMIPLIKYTQQLDEIHRFAKAIEGGTAKTERLVPTDGSAVGKADLPNNSGI